MTDEEKRIFEKYIRPGRRVLSRIKTWLKIKLRSPRIKTIKDVEYLDYDLFMKLLCLMMVYMVLSMVAGGILDLYYWVFPKAMPQDPAAFQPYIIPMIAKTLRGALHV